MALVEGAWCACVAGRNAAIAGAADGMHGWVDAGGDAWGPLVGWLHALVMDGSRGAGAAAAIR